MLWVVRTRGRAVAGVMSPGLSAGEARTVQTGPWGEAEAQGQCCTRSLAFSQRVAEPSAASNPQ